MKKLLPALLLLCVFASPALAWNCTDSLAARIPVPPGTSGSFGDGDGQLFLGTGSEGVKGQLYQCQVPKPPVTPPPPPVTPSPTQTVNQNQSQGQTQNSSMNSSTTSTSNAASKSTSSATGGNSVSTAVGGSATATGGSSGVKNSGNSTLTNSGNSSNTNNVSAQGGTGGVGGSGGAGGTSTSSNNSSGNSTSFSSVNNEVRQTPFAYAPDAAFTTSPCVKGFSGGLALPGGAGSLGVSKTDKGCDSRQTAVIFFALGNKTAAARILCSSDAAKRAKLSLDECLAIVAPVAPIVVPAPATVPQPQIIIVPVPTPAPVPVAVQPAPDCSQRKTVTQVHYTRVCKASTKIANIGFCRLYNGTPAPGCYVILDEAVGAIGSNNNARILLTGPVDSGKVVSYLKTHNVSLNRITLKLADEQNGTLTIQTEIGE